MRTTTLTLALLALIVSRFASADELTITTWNVETLGGDGRGFAGGFGRGDLPKRTNAQLKSIGMFIKNDLESDLVALQEVSITHLVDGQSRCAPLDTIAAELGPDWEYFLPFVDEIPDGHANMFCAFLWNSARIQEVRTYAMAVPNLELAGAALFDRAPLVGYFEAKNPGGAASNDFVIVNLHMKSGQHNEENHLIAMTLVEYRLTRSLRSNNIIETDRIILGDFNDNPDAKTEAGNQRFSDALYRHMSFKKYVDLVKGHIETTRMNSQLDSAIDHLLVNNSAQNHMPAVQASIFLPGGGDSALYADWRKTFSDHFPISFKLKIETDDDVDFEE